MNPSTPAAEAHKKELRRRSQDLIRVANPTGTDYPVRWDGDYIAKVPGNGQAVLPRYAAENYVKHMTDAILIDRSNKKIEQVNKLRLKAGQQPLNPQEREVQDLRISDMKLREEVMQTLILAVEKRYGMDQLEAEPEAPHITGKTNADIFDDIVGSLDTGESEATPAAEQLVEELS